MKFYVFTILFSLFSFIFQQDSFLLAMDYSSDKKLEIYNAQDLLTENQWKFLKNTNFFSMEEELVSYESYKKTFFEDSQTVSEQEISLENLLSPNPFLQRFIIKDLNCKEIVAFCQASPLQKFEKEGSLNLSLYTMDEPNYLLIENLNAILTNYFSPYFNKSFPFLDKDIKVYNRTISSFEITSLDTLPSGEIDNHDITDLNRYKEEVIQHICDIFKFYTAGNMRPWKEFTIFPCIINFEDKTAYAFGFKDFPGNTWEKEQLFYKNKEFAPATTMKFDLSIEENPEKFYFYPFKTEKADASRSHPLHTFIHERFHYYQHEHFAKKPSMAFDSFSPLYTEEENLKLILHSTYYLSQYLLTKDEKWITFYMQILKQREDRPDSVNTLNYENRLMVQEGLADFSTVKLLELVNLIKENYYPNTISLNEMIDKPLDYISSSDSPRHYLEGYALAEFLRCHNKTDEWQTQIEQGESLLNLFLRAAEGKVIENIQYPQENIEILWEIEKKFMESFTKAKKEKLQIFSTLAGDLYKDKMALILRLDSSPFTSSASSVKRVLLNSEVKIIQYKDKKVEKPDFFTLSLHNQNVIEKSNLRLIDKDNISRKVDDIIFGLHNKSSFLIDGLKKDFEKLMDESPFIKDTNIQIINDFTWDIGNINSSIFTSIELQTDKTNFKSQNHPFAIYKQVTREGYKELVVHYL